MPLCPSCGEDNSARARFCQACGRELAEARSPERFRKVVTILFSDVVGSTALGEALDPETLSHVMTEYFHAMAPVIERHGGTVAKFIGDAVMGVFGLPILHEDDAVRAVRAAIEMRDRLAELNPHLQRRWGVTIATRTGLATGAVAGQGLARDQNFVAGDAANTAARLQQRAGADEILLADATYQLVRDAVEADALAPMDMKNKAAPVAAFRLIALAAGGSRDDTAVDDRDRPLVGRAAEMAKLQDALARTVDQRTCNLVTLLGPPGVGKSRLAREFLVAAGGSVRVLRGRCLPYGEGITYWPLAQALRHAAGIAERDTPEKARGKLEALADMNGSPDVGVVTDHVARVIGLPDATGSAAGAGSPQEIPWAVRKFLERLAAERPLVLVLDDLQWAEPTLLDVVEHVATTSAGTSILLLCLARPEFADARREWADAIVLPPLSEAESERMVESILEGGGLAPGIADRIVRASGGIPLFVEQLLSMLVDQGLLERTSQGWEATADLSNLAIPPTIHALLSARLDGIPRDERLVLRLASVIGEVFYVGALRELAPQELAGGLDDTLRSLVRKDLVRPDRSDLGEEEAFAFEHLLIRDAAYEGLTKEDRAGVHERFAGWLARTAGDRMAEVDEIVGYHLERSWRYRTELGPVGAEARAVAREASGHLGRAGVRAFGRAEMSAAANLLERAITLDDRDTVERAELLLSLSEALRYHGELDRAREVQASAEALADLLGDPRLRGRALLGGAGILFSTDTSGWLAKGDGLLDTADALLGASGDEGGRAVVCRFRGYLAMERGQTAQAERCYLAGVRHARAAGDGRELANCLSNELLALAFGLTPVDQALARCDEEERPTAGPHMAGSIGLSKMPLLAVIGDFEGARVVAERTRGLLEDIGLRRTVAGLFSLTCATVERLAGDLPAAEHVLQEGSAMLEEMRDSALGGALGGLGLVLTLQGRHAEAIALLDRAEPMVGTSFADSDLATIRSARALALSGTAPGEAVRLALETAAAVWDSELLIDAADWLLTVAEALRRAGEPVEAGRVAARALDMCTRKGNLVMSEQARRFAALAALDAGTLVYP